VYESSFPLRTIQDAWASENSKKIHELAQVNFFARAYTQMSVSLREIGGLDTTINGGEVERVADGTRSRHLRGGSSTHADETEEKMGRRGPSPKPTVLKILQGNPGRRPLNTREPMPEAIEPPAPPEYLQPLAKEKWRELSVVLARNRLLTALDLDTLAIYCEAYAKMRAADQFLRERGMYYPILTEDGNKIRYLQPFPQVAVAEHCVRIMLQAGDRLGLSPAARARISLPEIPPLTPALQLLDCPPRKSGDPA